MTLDQFNSSDKERLMHMRNLEEKQAEMTLVANIKKMELVALQLDAQLNAAKAGQPLPPPAPEKGGNKQDTGLLAPSVQGGNMGSQAAPATEQQGAAPERPMSDMAQPGEPAPPGTGG
jgi:hypothetical protein